MDIWLFLLLAIVNFASVNIVCKFFICTYDTICLTSWILFSFFWKLSFCPCLQRDKSLTCSSKSSSFLWPYYFSIELDVTSSRNLSRPMWILGGSKGELVKSPRLLDLNLRKGSAVYLSYNVCSWENFEWGKVSLPNPCPVEL